MSSARNTNETSKLIKSGTYRFFSLNATTVSDRFSRMVIKRMTDRGRATADEKHWTIGELFDEFVRGKLNVYPNYQRGLVSDPQWARELVSVCIMTSAPISPVYLHAVDGGYEVVDGAQRLSAYFVFMMGGYPIVDEAGNEYWFCSRHDRSHWSFIVGGDGNDGISSYVDDAQMPPNITRFAREVRPLLRCQRDTDPILPVEDQARMRGRKQSISVMPTTWDRELSILYVVYTGLKAWRQTKDECLVHMHDRASRALKQLEDPFIKSLKMAGLRFSNPTRQMYGVLLRTFAVIEGFAHVPVEVDERLYVELMFGMATQYAEKDPCPETISKIERGIEWMGRKGPAVGREMKSKTVMHPDHLCIFLYAVSVGESFQTRSVCTLLDFIGRSKPKRAELLESRKIADASEILFDYHEVISKKLHGSINLASMCRVGSRLVV